MESPDYEKILEWDKADELKRIDLIAEIWNY